MTTAASRPPMAPAGTRVSASSPTGASDDLPRCTASQQALYFPLPVNTNIENTVELTNPHDAMVLFKVKTSEVARYVVRPKVGVLHPKATVKLRFVLLGEQAKGVGDNCRDRFSVMTRFVAKGESVNDPAACWTGDGSTKLASKIHLPCKFTTDPLPEGLRSHMEPGGLTPNLTPRRPESVTAGLTPRSMASPNSTSAMPRPTEPELADPRGSTLAEKRRTAGSTMSPLDASASGEKTKSGLLPLSTIPAPGQTVPPDAKVPHRPTPTDPHPNKVLVEDIRRNIGTRKSAFQSLWEKSTPVVIVVPLMVLCYLLGAHSEEWMLWLEDFLGYLQQLLMRSVATPPMGASNIGAHAGAKA